MYGNTRFLDTLGNPDVAYAEFRVVQGKDQDGVTVIYDSFFPLSNQGPSREGPSGCLHIPDIKAIDLDGDDSLPVEVIDFMKYTVNQLQQMRIHTVDETDYRRIRKKQPKAPNPETRIHRDILHLAALCAD